MSTALDRIIAYKHDEVAKLLSDISETELRRAALDAPPPRGFRNALAKKVDAGRNGLICELKRKSPSAGEIAPGADPKAVAAEYERGGASCLSVLTDGPSFGGNLSDFAEIRQAVSLPMLRKDFMIHPAQIYESRAAGADAVLVILSAVDDTLAGQMLSIARELGMDSLIETHDRTEIQRALRLDGQFIGINNRNLKKMVTDLSVTESLAGELPDNAELVSESGIADVADIVRLRKTGARRFLIGESLMRRADRTAHVRRLVNAGSD